MVRSRLEIVYRILKAVEGGECKPTRLMHGSGLSHTIFQRYQRRLAGEQLLSMRQATDLELRKDKRSKVYLELTEDGRRMLRDLEALDRRCGGLFLEW